MSKCEACGEGAVLSESNVHPLLKGRDARLYGAGWTGWMCEDCGWWNIAAEGQTDDQLLP